MRLAPLLLTLLLATPAAADPYTHSGTISGIGAYPADGGGAGLPIGVGVDLEFSSDSRSGLVAYRDASLQYHLGVLDLTDLNNPQLVWSVAADAHSVWVDRNTGIGYALVGTPGGVSLLTVEMDGANSSILQTTPLTGDVFISASTDGLYKDGDLLYACANSLLIIDVWSPMAPLIMSSTPIIDTYFGTKPPEQHVCRSVIKHGSKMFFGSNQQPLIGFFDVSDPFNPAYTAICHHATIDTQIVDDWLCYSNYETMVICHDPIYNSNGEPLGGIWDDDIASLGFLDMEANFDDDGTGTLLYAYSPTGPTGGDLIIWTMDWSVRDPFRIATMPLDDHVYAIEAQGNLFGTVGQEELRIYVPEPHSTLTLLAGSLSLLALRRNHV